MRQIRIGNTLHVVVGSPSEEEAEVQKMIKALKPNGFAAVLEDRTRVFVIDEVDFRGGPGSLGFYWDRSGNKVRHTRFQVTCTPKGDIVRKPLRKVFKKLDDEVL